MLPRFFKTTELSGKPRLDKASRPKGHTEMEINGVRGLGSYWGNQWGQGFRVILGVYRKKEKKMETTIIALGPVKQTTPVEDFTQPGLGTMQRKLGSQMHQNYTLHKLNADPRHQQCR